MNRRPAFSLVELITVLTGVTLLLPLTVVLLTRAMQSQTETRHFFAAQRHALALSQQFREDVHQATAVELDRSKLQEGQLLRLTLGNQRSVIYRQLDHGMARVLSSAAGPAAHEEYSLGGDIKAIVKREGEPPRLQLSITAPNAAPPLPNEPASRIREKPALLQIEATLGADHRYATSAAAPGGSP